MTVAPPPPAVEPRSRPSRAHALVPLAIALLAFATLAPRLSDLEFANTPENAVIASALEVRRGGTWQSWLVPTLHDEARTKKPPLTTWITALAMRPATVEGLGSSDPEVRRAAYEHLAWQARWPALLAACGLLMGAYWLGAVIEGPQLGLAAALVCGSSMMWLRQAGLATTDMQLALWVTLANVMLARAILQGKVWSGFVGAGAALGLALMSKGPVALVQSVLPFVVFCAWRAWACERTASPTAPRRTLALIAGVVVMCAIGSAWYIGMIIAKPEVLSVWYLELLGRAAVAGSDSDPIYNHLLIVGYLFPWAFFLIIGLIGGGMALARRAGDHVVLLLMLVVVPVAILSCFSDRKERYLLPVLGPAATLAAWGVLDLFRTRQGRGAHLLTIVFHWLPLVGVGVAVALASSPVLGRFKTVDGGPWLSTISAIILAALFVTVFAEATIAALKASPLSWVVVRTAVLMLMLYLMLFQGYASSRGARSEGRPMAEAIRAAVPGAHVFSFRPDQPTRHAPLDVEIYLNRAVDDVPELTALPEPADGEPRVVLVQQRSRKPRPDGPPGWRQFAEVEDDQGRWLAFTDAPLSPPR